MNNVMFYLYYFVLYNNLYIITLSVFYKLILISGVVLLMPSPQIYELCVPHLGICLGGLNTLIMVDIVGHTDSEASTLYLLLWVHTIYHVINCGCMPYSVEGPS